MPIDLRNKSIIITGASSGIGAATAIECAKAGMHVLLTARRADRLNAVATRCIALGVRVETIAADVTDAGLNERLLEMADAKLGGVYAVFSNAGYGMDKPVHLNTGDEARRMMDVNFNCGLDLLSAAARRLIAARRPGHLLMCSSILARLAVANHGLYCATKAAQDQVCRAMRMELRTAGIHVSSVHPITTVTEFSDVSQALSHPDRAADRPSSASRPPGFFIQPAEQVARAVARCLRRPRAEVWTTLTLRFVTGMMGVAPVFFHRIIAMVRPPDPVR